MNKKVVWSLAAVGTLGLVWFFYSKSKKDKDGDVDESNQKSIEQADITASFVQNAPLTTIPNPVEIAEDDLFVSDTNTEKPATLPGVVIRFDYDNNAQNTGNTFFNLGFTPTTANKEPSDIDFKKDPWKQLSDVKNLTDARLEKMISPTELKKIVQKCDLTPTKNLSVVQSPNRKNIFLIGFSNKLNIQLGAGGTTPAYNILWAISFGVPFDRRPHKQASLNDLEDSTFSNVAVRTLMAETGGKLKLGALTPFVSDVQKAAILSALKTRKNRKVDRGIAPTPVTFETVIKSDDKKPTRAKEDKDRSNDRTSKWAFDIPFHCFYSGRLDHKCATTFAEALLLSEEAVPEAAKKEFDRFFEQKYWQLPDFVENGGTHLFHYKTKLAPPDWLSSTSSHVKDEDSYFHHRHPIRIGNGILIDRSQEMT